MRTIRWKCLFAIALLLSVGSAGAIFQLPLLGANPPVPPNLVFTLDDSGSMDFECLPDALCVAGASFVGALPWGMGAFKNGVASPGSVYGRRMRSADVNPLAYNPAIRYQPWLRADGTRFPAYPATAAVFDARVAASAIDLTREQAVTATWCTAAGTCTAAAEPRAFFPAVYYRLNAGAAGTQSSDFTEVRIGAEPSHARSSSRTDCVSTTNTCSAKEELQNLSNWFTYASSRLKLAIGATSEAFGSVSESHRVGFGTLNTLGRTVDGVATDTLQLGVRPFGGDAKAAFYRQLQSAVADRGDTPLRRAMDDVGQYFSRKDNRGPWGATPGTDDSTPHSSCRRSVHVLMTDGMWNGAGAKTAAAAGEVDNLAGPTITGPKGQTYRYSPQAPYAGAAAGTLADVALYYWSRDLRDDLGNDLAADRPDPNDPADPQGLWTRNPAFWQHMVNYTIAFGAAGRLRDPESRAGLESGALAWGTPAPDAVANVDDLWHAAVNSRGRAYSARNPAEYAQGLNAVLAAIDDGNKLSQAGVALSGRTMAAGTRAYVPVYRPDTWSGDVQAVIPGQSTPVWEASRALPAPAQRNIHSYGNGRGIPFTKARLQGLLDDLLGGLPNPALARADGLRDATLQSSLQSFLGDGHADKLIDYLRGDRSNEGRGKAYRARDANSLLGDIVNSTPIFVKDLVDSQYDFLPAAQAGQSAYLAFLQRKKARPGLVFAGANDGMLHAFSDVDGSETFAFVPSTVLAKLPALSNRQHSHQYLVDGPVSEFDVYDTAGSRWRNIVVGSGGAGARNLFALNVPVADTAALPATAAMGASDVLWEVNSSMDDFAEMGYLPQRAEAGTMRDGSWVVIVGNGYESRSAKAQLFVIDALTGRRLSVLDTGMGSGTQRNGLGVVRVLRDAQRRIVAAYAGDLQGHLWKFDFSSSDPADWKVAFGTTNGAPNPLFMARDAQGAAEPITAAPALLQHPGGGVMVMFGTGKLLDESDPASTAQRSLYGVWDKVAVGADSSGAGGALTDANALVAQEVTPLTLGGSTSGQYYAVSSHAVDYGAGVGQRGWLLRLTIQGGQRQIYEPVLAKGRVIFDSLVPIASGSICTKANARSYTFVLDPFTGGAAADGPTLDTDRDGRFSSADSPAAAVFASDGLGRRAIGSSTGRDLVSIGSSGGSPGGGSVSTERIQGSKNAVTRSWNQIVNIPRR